MEIKPHQAEQVVKGMQRAKIRAEEFEKIKSSEPNDVGTVWGKFGFYSPLEELEILINQMPPPFLKNWEMTPIPVYFPQDLFIIKTDAT